jgi:hypothetical protein
VEGDEVVPHPAGGHGAVLDGVADEPDGGAGGRTAGEQPVEGAVADGGGFVDDEHGAGIEGAVVGIAEAVEVPGKGFGEDPAFVTEVAGGFGFHGRADHPVAGCLPGGDSGAHGVGLAGAGPADAGLGPVSAGAERSHELALLCRQFAVVGEGGVEDGGVDGAGATGDAVPIAAEDVALEGKHVGGRVLGLVVATDGEGGPVGALQGVGVAGRSFELNDPGGAQQLVGESFERGGGHDERARPVRVREVDQRGEQVATGEDRPLRGHRCGRCVEDLAAEPGAENGGAGPAEGLVQASGGEPVPSGAFPPLGEQVGLVSLRLGGPGRRDDCVELVEGAGAAEGVLELADGVVDLAAALAELVEH